MKPIFWRIIAGIFIFLALVLLPWWMTFIFLLIAVIYFNFYYEAVFAGFLLDSLYGSPNFFSKFIFTLIFGLLILVIEFLKKRLRFN
jgi:hypothetical protein